jgi:hypothetical protein
MFFSCGANVHKPFAEPDLQQATYNCPHGKHSSFKSVPTPFKDWYLVLLIIIAKHTLMGNCKHLISNGYADTISCMMGIEVVFPFAYSVKL